MRRRVNVYKIDQHCQDLSARQDANGRGYNIEQPYGAQSWQELPENPLRLQRIPGNKSRQRVDQCMHGAQDEHGYPIMKPTGFGSNIRWKHTGLRCGGHCGVPHTQLKGTGPSGLTRTSMSAVYPKGMCQGHHPVPGLHEPTQAENLAT